MSFQVSTMQLLAEAHNHEEGWFQKQMCALVLKAGSDQGSLGSREDARGQGGSHATCAEAWPSSSDEGGPSYGAREALVVQKGKSGTAGTRSTSLCGAGTSSTARKRSGPRVELAVRGLEDKSLGAGPDRRFKTPPGTGASKNFVVIWIVGDSMVHWAGKRANSRPYGKNLGLSMEQVEVTWWGMRGMRWGRLFPLLISRARGRRAPDIIIIHVGGNDVAKLRSIDLFQQIKQHLARMLTFWPGVQLVWSEIICRLVWKGARIPGRVNKTRKRLNRMVGNFVVQCGGWVIRHPQFSFKLGGWFREDGVQLSDVGVDMFNNELQEGLEEVIRGMAVRV
ncbi:uncharacterized protein LOC142464074 isoform X2 [Ascaphus truei]|uniref:uncharacterized protein LOC142464074 isoform X2 n=1 Tax=Ascaphus truei TaxID=8439 RepID=UPI003F5A7594